MMESAIFTPEILRLTVQLPLDSLLDAPMASVEKRSPVCGSRVTLDVNLDGNGQVAEVGVKVRACRIGQASAALMLANVYGKDAAELAAALSRIKAWVEGARKELPDWPGLEVLLPAIAYRGKHAAILLAFEAAAEAAALAAREEAA